MRNFLFSFLMIFIAIIFVACGSGSGSGGGGSTNSIVGIWKHEGMANSKYIVVMEFYSGGKGKEFYWESGDSDSHDFNWVSKDGYINTEYKNGNVDSFSYDGGDSFSLGIEEWNGFIVDWKFLELVKIR